MAPRSDTLVSPSRTLSARRHSRKPTKPAEKIPHLGVVAPPPIHVESPHFQGSLATLFSFVHEKKVDLLDVPLFPICEAYFCYLLEISDRNLDEAAAALMALSYLLERKAWLLLPTPEPEPELEEAKELLAPSAHEYQMAIEALQLWHEERERVFFRTAEASPDAYEVPFELGNVSASDLARALERVLRRATAPPVTPVHRARRSLSEEMRRVLKTLSNEWAGLETLLPEQFTREDAVYAFLALLELIRLGQAQVQLHGEDVLFSRA